MQTNPKAEKHTVEKATSGKGYKSVLLSNGQVYHCPRSRAVHAGDSVFVGNEGITKSVSNGSVVVYPSYASASRIVTGDESLHVRFSEPMTDEELRAIEDLRRFHYRDRLPFGRQAVIMATTSQTSTCFSETPLGFVETGFAPLCNSARDRILDSSYSDGSFAWSRWRHAERGYYGRLIVSISRIVVNPDYRGIGIGSELLKHCVRYLSQYWESSNAKPLFLEIVADMLKFNTFPRNAGLTFVGFTEGNARRVAKDTKYYVREVQKGEVSFDRPGVERMQQRAALLIRERALKQSTSIRDAVAVLRNVDEKRYLQNYDLLHDIVRLPKPTWMTGLTPTAREFVLERAAKLGIIWRRNDYCRQKTTGTIRFDNVSVTRKIGLSREDMSVRTAAAFGISPSGLTVSILSNVCFEIRPRDICVIDGPSGSGKSMLLRLLSGEMIPHQGHVIVPGDCRPRMTAPLAGKCRVIEAIGGSLEESLRALAMAGLSDARLCIQQVSTLSQGQKERLRIARLVCSRSNLWLVDDFAAFLDHWSARVVSMRMASVARALGVTLVIASPRASDFLDVLRPDLILRVTSGGSVVSLRDVEEAQGTTPPESTSVTRYVSAYDASSCLANGPSIASLS